MGLRQWQHKRVAVVQQHPGPAGINAANGPQDALNAQLVVLQGGLNSRPHLREPRLLPQRLQEAAENQHDGSLHGTKCRRCWPDCAAAKAELHSPQSAVQTGMAKLSSVGVALELSSCSPAMTT